MCYYNPICGYCGSHKNSRMSNFKQFNLVQFNNIFQVSILSMAQGQILGIKI